MDEIFEICKGRLGQYYKLALKTKIEKEPIEGKNILNIRLRMLQITKPEPVLICKNKAIVKLYLNNEFIDKFPVEINFTNTDTLTLCNYTKGLFNQDTVLNKIKLVLEVNEESGYLETTEINQTISIIPPKEDKLFIDLTSVDRSSSVYCLAIYNIKPLFLEYKVDQNPWTKLDLNSPNFTFEKNGKNQYAQVRGKLDNYYSYSNTIKVLKQE
jgi:hypothetical protein